jgi:hypothetical protein
MNKMGTCATFSYRLHLSSSLCAGQLGFLDGRGERVRRRMARAVAGGVERHANPLGHGRDGDSTSCDAHRVRSTVRRCTSVLVHCPRSDARNGHWRWVIAVESA